MEVRCKTYYEAKSEDNWERIKKNHKYIYYFKELYDNRELIKDIDENELYTNLKKIRSYRYALISTDSNDWIPSWVINVNEWIKANGLKHSIITSFAMSLIEKGRKDLLKVLAKAGDKFAKPRKIRTKLPKELIGQTVKFEKINETEWKITILKETESICEYEKQYNWFYGDE